MTQEDKNILLKDLCARLSYKLRVKYYYYTGETHGYADEGFLTFDYLNSFKTEQTITVWGGKRVYNIVPYLRPMSSMTEEEKMHFWCLNHNPNTGVDFMTHAPELIDWLNENYFDYRGLIEKGLALEASEGMYKIE